MLNALDRDWMSLALDAGREGTSQVYPNPRVGALVVRKGKLLSQGAHLKAGCAHAEVNALEQCEDAVGATLYVTLEPCSHRGKTPPCTQLILKKGITRVVYGLADPGPGRGGAEVLRKAGLEVDGPMMDLPGLVELLEPFCKNILKQETYFIQKWAMTLDGKIASVNGDSKWISNENSRKKAHKVRAYADGIMVGAGTVLADQPSLSLRHEVEGPDSCPIVWDPEAETKFLGPWWEKLKQRNPLVISKSNQGWPEFVESIQCEDPSQLGAVLFRRGLHCVLVEGGAGLHGVLNDANLTDAIMAFIAPIWIGGKTAPSAIGGKGVEEMSQAKRLIRQEISYYEGDLLLEGLAKVHHPDFVNS